MESIVALDIETTGLDPDKDAIIEIGAVRFREHRVEAEWSTLVNPARHIPPFITQLTGITDQMVVQAPSIRDVLANLAEFVGNAPVLGHNVRFDLSFLRKYGILRNNTALDTYEMAAVLLPNAGRYNLGALAQALGVLYPATHRALDDARATRGVFLRLYEEALAIATPLLAEIIRLSEAIEWAGYYPLRLALRARSKEVVSAEFRAPQLLRSAIRGTTRAVAGAIAAIGTAGCLGPGRGRGNPGAGRCFCTPIRAFRVSTSTSGNAALDCSGALRRAPSDGGSRDRHRQKHGVPGPRSLMGYPK